MATKSWQGVALGVLVAFALPIVYLVCTLLVQRGILDLATMDGLAVATNSLTWNAVVALVLALAGSRMVGLAAGLRSAWAWFVVVAVALPVVGFVWFVTYATLGGVLGRPF